MLIKGIFATGIFLEVGDLDSTRGNFQIMQDGYQMVNSRTTDKHLMHCIL